MYFHHPVTTVTKKTGLRHKILRFALISSLPFPLVPTMTSAHEQVIGEEGFFEDIPMVIAGTRLPQAVRHSPVATSILDRETIVASGFTDIAELFRLVPGFNVGQATGGHYVVTYHGQEISVPSRLEVIIDGRSVYDNLLSTVSWSTLGIEIEDIERIEIIRGSNAPVFGSNAFAAIINITTVQPLGNEGTSVNAVAGSLGTEKLFLSHASTSSAYDYRLSLGAKRSDGYSFPEGYPDFDEMALTNANYRGQVGLAENSSLDISLALTSGEISSALPDPGGIIAEHDGGIDSSHAHLRWTHALAADNEYYLQFYYNHHDQTDDLKSYPLAQILPPEALNQLAAVFPNPGELKLESVFASGVSERYDLEGQHIFSGGERLRIVWGGGLRLDRLKSPTHLAHNQFIDNLSARIFTNLEWLPSEKYTLNFGGMLEHNEIIATYGSARVAVNYHVNESTTLRASVSHAEKSPSLLEEHWDYGIYLAGGPLIETRVKSFGNLSAERLLTYELGIVSGFNTNRLTLETKIFREDATRLISFPSDPNYPEFANVDGEPGAQIVGNDNRYQLDGIEGEINWRLDHRNLVRVGYALIDSQSERHAFINQPPAIFNNATARRSVSLLALHSLENGVSFSGGYYHLSSIQWLGNGDFQPAYDRVDLRIGLPVKLKHVDGLAELVAQNIGNSYTEYMVVNNFDTRWFAKLKLQF